MESVERHEPDLATYPDYAEERREDREDREYAKSYERLRRNNVLLAWWCVGLTLAFMLLTLWCVGAGEDGLAWAAGVMTAAAWTGAFLSGEWRR